MTRLRLRLAVHCRCFSHRAVAHGWQPTFHVQPWCAGPQPQEGDEMGRYPLLGDHLGGPRKLGLPPLARPYVAELTHAQFGSVGTALTSEFSLCRLGPRAASEVMGPVTSVLRPVLWGPCNIF